MLVSTAAIDVSDVGGIMSLSYSRVRQTKFTFVSYFGSYQYRINIAASQPLKASVVPVRDYSGMVSGQTQLATFSALINHTGSLEFTVQERGYYVLSLEIEGTNDITDLALSYSFSRSLQSQFLTDGLLLTAAGAILLISSSAIIMRQERHHGNC